jgi:hypothetical protein
VRVATFVMPEWARVAIQQLRRIAATVERHGRVLLACARLQPGMDRGGGGLNPSATATVPATGPVSGRSALDSSSVSGITDPMMTADRPLPAPGPYSRSGVPSTPAGPS